MVTKYLNSQEVTTATLAHKSISDKIVALLHWVVELWLPNGIDSSVTITGRSSQIEYFQMQVFACEYHNP